MNKLALQLPGSSPIPQPSPVGSKFTDLGSVLSGLLNVALFITVFLTFYFMVWGAFAYIMAQGKKEELAKARSRITWAIIGLFIVFLAYFIAKFGAEIFPPRPGGVPF